MSIQRNFVVKNITPTTGTWVELPCPSLCNFIEIANQCTVDIKFRTDSADAATEITIPVNDSYVIVTPVYNNVYGTTRFVLGNTIGYAQLSASGTGKVVGVFIL